MNFANKTALVTGGAAGIGQEIVSQFVEAGARVISVDWNGPENERVARRMAGSGTCVPVRADVSVASDVENAFRTAGPIDILVNNAAYSQGDGFLTDISEDVWDKTLAVCLKSVYLCTKAVIPGMVRRGSGCIINISSVNALAGIHLVAYTAAKGGINALTRVLAAQYGGAGIRVNAICPGTILSESSRVHYEANPQIAAELKALYPAGVFGSTADIASLVLFLASAQASFINGAVIPIDGGLSAVRPLQSLIARRSDPFS